MTTFKKIKEQSDKHIDDLTSDDNVTLLRKKMEEQIIRDVFGDFIKHTMVFFWSASCLQIATYGVSYKQLKIIIEEYKADNIIIRNECNKKVLLEIYW